MKQSLKGFVADWNWAQSSDTDIAFSLREVPTIDHPCGISVRFKAIRYADFCSAERWEKLDKTVEAKSHGTMFVSTNQRLFEKGIIEIEVASLNHNYQERYAISVLRWIGEKLFPQDAERGKWKYAVEDPPARFI